MLPSLLFFLLFFNLLACQLMCMFTGMEVHAWDLIPRSPLVSVFQVCWWLFCWVFFVWRSFILANFNDVHQKIALSLLLQRFHLDPIDILQPLATLGVTCIEVIPFCCFLHSLHAVCHLSLPNCHFLWFSFCTREHTHDTRARARAHTHTHMRPRTQHLEVLEDADINSLGLKVVQGRLLQRMLAHVKVKVCHLGKYGYSSFYTQECRGRRGWVVICQLSSIFF